MSGDGEMAAVVVRLARDWDGFGAMPMDKPWVFGAGPTPVSVSLRCLPVIN